MDRKPVLATTAADDMKLVTEEEVAQVMEKLVFIKAERMSKHLTSADGKNILTKKFR